MHCPKCNHTDTKVVDTRLGKNSISVRRRRQCQSCSYRFTTIEEILREGLVVIKRDGSRELFDKHKMLIGIHKATEKRPIEAEQIEMLVADLFAEIERDYDAEIPSIEVGELIMKRLKEVDHIAYVRFASVYKEFRSLDELSQEIEQLREPTGTLNA